MPRPTPVAVRLRRVALLLAAGTVPIAATASEGTTSTPSMVGAVAAAVSADPQEPGQPRDMTLDRSTRRAMRSRSRTRTAPDRPESMGDLRDLTVVPEAPTATMGSRRFDAILGQDLEDSWIFPSRRAARAHGGGYFSRDPELIRTPEMASASRVAPAAPILKPAPDLPVDAERPAEFHPPRRALAAIDFGHEIRLTHAEARLQPTPTAPGAPTLVAPEAPVDAPPAAMPEPVRGLNKPIRDILLSDPADMVGRRPANVAAELQRPLPTVHISGSPFAAAHPQRYLYCFSHNPLYFEDANLERCGISHGCCQPAASAAQFIGRTALLPYSLIKTPPGSCVRTLGDCPTCHAYPWGVDLEH